MNFLIMLLLCCAETDIPPVNEMKSLAEQKKVLIVQEEKIKFRKQVIEAIRYMASRGDFKTVYDISVIDKEIYKDLMEELKKAGYTVYTERGWLVVTWGPSKMTKTLEFENKMAELRKLLAPEGPTFTPRQSFNPIPR